MREFLAQRKLFMGAALALDTVPASAGKDNRKPAGSVMPLYKARAPSNTMRMHFNLTLFLAALGLAFVLESLPWLLAPGRMRDGLRQLLELPPETLRVWGFVLLGLGLGLAALSRYLWSPL